MIFKYCSAAMFTADDFWHSAVYPNRTEFVCNRLTNPDLQGMCKVPTGVPLPLLLVALAGIQVFQDKMEMYLRTKKHDFLKQNSNVADILRFDFTYGLYIIRHVGFT